MLATIAATSNLAQGFAHSVLQNAVDEGSAVMPGSQKIPDRSKALAKVTAALLQVSAETTYREYM
jgi:hypothetical protein